MKHMGKCKFIVYYFFIFVYNINVFHFKKIERIISCTQRNCTDLYWLFSTKFNKVYTYKLR